MSGIELPRKRRAEISGWDVGEEFFVERVELTDSESGVMYATLQSRLTLGSLVFIRWAGNRAISSPIPMLFRVSQIEANASRGQMLALEPYRSQRPARSDLMPVTDRKLIA